MSYRDSIWVTFPYFLLTNNKFMKWSFQNTAAGIRLSCHLLMPSCPLLCLVVVNPSKECSVLGARFVEN